VLLLENKWERKNTELILDFDEYEIEANEELLKEVWINLLDNAVKFSPRCGTVSVSISESIGQISVTVSNTGSEISPENMKKIWNKFYQSDESHASEGNGVGLAIVKRVVELHGGAISVKSGDGMTSFTVDLPVK
jgi:signal transduction histidine kinase